MIYPGGVISALFERGKMARYISLYSGSSGNCSAIEENGKFILIDMGKSARLTAAALHSAGLDVRDCHGILISHEHSDHTAGLKVFLKNRDIPVYTNAETRDFLTDRELIPAHIHIEDMGYKGVDIGDFFVSGFYTPHDSVGCMGFRINTKNGSSMSMATDLGHINENILQNLMGVDLAVVESNYDEKMLKEGVYPDYLKRRILSNNGHLSNVQSSMATIRLIESGVKKIHLCHLSENNNTPRIALGEVLNTALRYGYEIDGDVTVKANRRHDITAPTEF